MKPNRNIDLSFHITNKQIQNIKYFVYKEKKYPVNFDLIKMNSEYFHRNQEQFNQINDINLLNETEEGIIAISDETIKAFTSSCINEPCKIKLSDVIPLQYLAYKFEFPQLITITERFIEEHSEDLVFQSFLFKFGLQTQNNNDYDIPELFYNTQKEEEIIIKQFDEYIDYPEVLLLPIPVLDRIFHQSVIQNKEKMKKNSPKITDFLFKCLDKYGIDASILFSHVDFEKQSVEVIERLVRDYSSKFDFNMINSTLSKTTIQLTSELNRQKEEYSLLFKQMMQKFNEQQDELVRMKEEQIKREKQFLERMKQMDASERSRKQIFEEKMNQVDEKENERENIFEERMKQIDDNEEKRANTFEEKMKQLHEIENKREKLFLKKMNQIDEKEEERERIFEEKMKQIDEKEEESSKIAKRDVIQMKKAKYQIFLRIIGRKPISILVQPSDTINDIKTRILEKEGIPIYYQYLTYNSKVLNDESTIQSNGIQACSVIALNIRAISLKGKITISFKKQFFTLDWQPDKLIKEIKDEIEDFLEIPSSNQHLFYNFRELDDDSKIADYSIFSGYTLILEVSMYDLIQIFIQPSYKQPKLALNVVPTIKIIKIKEQIQQINDVPIMAQKLLFNGNTLQDDQTLQQLSITNDSTLILSNKQESFHNYI